MPRREHTSILDQNSGAPFCLPVSPFAATALLMIALNENCLQMYAATLNMTLNEIAARHAEVLRAMKSAALLSCWPQSCLANPAAIAAPGHSLFELIFQPFSATVPMLSKTFPNGSSGMPFSSEWQDDFHSEQRASAAVINFPERPKSGN